VCRCLTVCYLIMQKHLIGSWAVAILLAIVFVLVGLTKVAGPSVLGWAIRFRSWGYPAVLVPVVGAVEVFGGSALLLPKLRRGASATLISVMAGAIVTHAVHAEYARVIPPLVLAGFAFLVGFRRG